VVSGLRYRCKPLRHVLLDLTPCTLVKIAWKGKATLRAPNGTSVRRENDIVVAVIYLPHAQWGLSFRGKTWTPGKGNMTMTVDGLPNEVVAS
jgi:hypothetical protein